MEIITIDVLDGHGVIDVAVGSYMEASRLRKYLKDATVAIDAEAARTDDASNDSERLDWLEQHGWHTERECFDFVDAWRTPDGKRHGGGLRDAIDAMQRS